jgi:hypothetical protein
MYVTVVSDYFPIKLKKLAVQKAFEIILLDIIAHS